MFKVGDKGKTRNGCSYEVTSFLCEPNEWFGIDHPVIASINGENPWRSYSHNGMYTDGLREDDMDLMPPESSETVEMPECECDEEVYEYDFADVAKFAAQIARDNPDMIVQVTPGSHAITMFAA